MPQKFSQPQTLGLLLLVFGLSTSFTAAFAQVPQEMEGLPLLVSEDFEAGNDNWVMTDPRAWKVIEEKDDAGALEKPLKKVLALKRPSKYKPPVRSPLSIARIKDLFVSDFIMDVTVKQTGKEYGHRDMCFFYGYQGPANFYYTHLATKADAHANSIFLVNNEPRVSIAKERTDGTDWAKGYHHVRIKRDTASGRIEIFFNNMDKPVMVAEDKHFLCGAVGVGSFDDLGRFDNIRVWGKKVDCKEAAAASAK